MSKLLEQVREAVRTRHYSLRPEEAYLRRVREYILFGSVAKIIFERASVLNTFCSAAIPNRLATNFA